MTRYFIDYENVGNTCFEILKHSNRGDSVTIFYSQNRNRIDLENLSGVLTKELRINLFKADVGTKNALDFQLVMFLGMSLGTSKNRNDKWIIISNDKGFDAAVKLAKHSGYNVERISTAIDNETKTSIDKEEVLKRVKLLFNEAAANPKMPISKEEIISIVGEDVDIDELLEVCNDSSCKTDFHNNVAKIVKNNDKSKAIYKSLLPLMIKKGHIYK